MGLKKIKCKKRKEMLSMKRTMKLMMCMVMVLALMFGLSGCGDSEKQQEAIDTFNEVSEEFDEIADMMNENADAIDEQTFAKFQEVQAALAECKDALESEEDAPDEDYEVMIDSLTQTKDWLKEARTDVEAQISAAGE